MKQGRRTAVNQMLLGFGFSSMATAANPPTPTGSAAPPPAFGPIEEALGQLLRIRRLHVQELSGGEAASQIRDMIIASFQSAGFFLLTENPDRADAFLKGTAEDLVFNEQFSSSDDLGARTSLSAATGGIASRDARRGGLSAGISQSEDVRINERKHEALAAVRIVNKDGDVLWSTTQESLGAKFRGASADVAEKITRQLRADLEKARKLPPQLATNRD
ncbi:MAG: hypothetical protein K7J46_20440 [Bryobacter sp.]|nr:hypothetical protein [Bryobacter sp. CoA8 C33]